MNTTRERRSDPSPTAALPIPLSKIEFHSQDVRNAPDEAQDASLAGSIRQHGVLQPVVLRPLPESPERFELIAGKRRVIAARKAGKKFILATVREANDAEALELMLVENLQRRDLSTIEKARALDLLCMPIAQGGAGKTQLQAAMLFGHDQPWASNLIRLLKLPPEWQARVESGEIDVCKARVLLPYREDEYALAAIEQDMQARPEAYRTVEDFGRNATLAADRLPESRIGRAPISQEVTDTDGGDELAGGEDREPAPKRPKPDEKQLRKRIAELEEQLARGTPHKFRSAPDPAASTESKLAYVESYVLKLVQQIGERPVVDLLRNLIDRINSARVLFPAAKAAPVSPPAVKAESAPPPETAPAAATAPPRMNPKLPKDPPPRMPAWLTETAV